jgi:peptide/nickel transport system substrate-binding protein
MVSPTAVAKLNDRFGASPVGTGPFKLLRWDKGQRIILERNADYWGGAPRLDRIVSVTYVEPQARVAALQTGEAQLIEGVPLDFVEALSQDPRFQRITAPSPHVWYVVLNTSRGPLQDLRVRRAMNHAVDKTQIVRDVLRGFPVVADGPLSPVFADYQTDLVKYEYDPQKARDLLTEAGHANGFELLFSIAESGTGMQEPVSMATVIQANLAAVGIKVRLQTFEWGAYQSIRTSGNFDMAAFSWTPGIGNPDVILYSKFHRSQFPPNGYDNAFWGSEQLDRMLEEARTTTDDLRRIELYKSAQKLIVQGASHIWVDHDINQVLATANLRGFKVHPTSDFYISPELALA